MLALLDESRYDRHQRLRAECSPSRRFTHELALPGLLFGAVGAITWAIRGTNGWGGVDGTIVPGMAWGVLWYYVCRRNGIDARWVSLWLGLGIAVGGELGYGQYVSWIQGRFETPTGPTSIAPWIGYVWFVICGIGWGAPGGIVLGWALSGRASILRWVARILVPAAIACAGWLAVQTWPAAFFPHYDLGIYVGELHSHQDRTVYTNTQNFVVLMWWVGAMLTAAAQRDRATFVMGGLIGGGFGIGFTLGALWCLGYTYAPGWIDWWKVWELNAGFNLGLLYAVALWWTVRRVDAGRVDGWAPAPRSRFAERAADTAFTLTLFLLLYVLFRGASSSGGALLGLYNLEDAGQYASPPGRMALFMPFMLTVTVGCMVHLGQRLRNPGGHRLPVGRLAARMTVLLGVFGFVGVVTIWPSKIAALYSAFLCVALAAHGRLTVEYAAVDRSAGESPTPS